MITLFLFAQLSAATPPSRGAAPVMPAVFDSARDAADAFVRTWRFYWESSEALRNQIPPVNGGGRRLAAPISPLDTRGHAPLVVSAADSLLIAVGYKAVVPTDARRFAFRHCHPAWASERNSESTAPKANPVIVPRKTTGVRGAPVAVSATPSLKVFEDQVIRSGLGQRAVCPSWYPGGRRPPWDERQGIDAAILPEAQGFVRAARDSLLRILDRAAASVRDDQWLVGQRVRFALDQGDTLRAASAVNGCRSEQWWCAMLRGYLAAIRGEVVAADSVFATGVSLMPPPIRCQWTALGPLFGELGQTAYNQIDCDRREAVNSRIWWLSDLFWTDDGNDRRAEHFARAVAVALQLGTRLNERLDLRDVGGGRAARDMLTRYGAPSFTAWGGFLDDMAHFSYLDISDSSIVDHGLFMTAEYTEPRIHSVPNWSAIADPFGSDVFDWVLNPEANRVAKRRDTEWWPTEHFERKAMRIVQLRDQHAMFRRETNVLLAFASDFFAGSFGGRVGDTLKGSLILSTAADSMRTSPWGAVIGFSAAFRSLIEPKPQMVGLELFHGHPDTIAARTRFGVAPPPPLAAMQPGDRAISDVAFIVPPDGPGGPADNPDAALSRMFGSTVFAELKRFGIYWETYGIADSDTVDVSIRIERIAEPPGFMQRLAMRIGIGAREDGGVTVAWREPSSGHPIWSKAGRIPLQARHVYMNLSQMRPGEYRAVIRVTPARNAALVTTRNFSILP